LLVQHLDQYLAQNLPSPNLLPVVVAVTIPARTRQVAGLVIQPGDTVAGLKERVITQLSETGVKVHGYSPGARLMLHNPGAGEAVVDDDGVFQLGLRVLPGATFVLNGDVVLDEDLPAICVRHAFDKAVPTPQDYWTCNTCNTNWICAGCRRKCHDGHDLVAYLEHHTPSWGCCYCKKKGTCQLVGHSEETSEVNVVVRTAAGESGLASPAAAAPEAPTTAAQCSMQAADNIPPS
jgi:hypothetical protein